MPPTNRDRSPATARQKLLLVVGATAAALALVVAAELLLGLLGIGDDADADPFFDFEAVTGLYERVETPHGPVLRTRPSKLAFFNPQELPARKPEHATVSSRSADRRPSVAPTTGTWPFPTGSSSCSAPPTPAAKSR